MLDDAAAWSGTSDPSVSLSPYTRERLELARDTERLELIGGGWVESVERVAEYVVQAGRGGVVARPAPPIMATGFTGSLQLLREHFIWDETGRPVLASDDENGPRRRASSSSGRACANEGMVFCYIYKFRQRFAVVAAALGEHLRLRPRAARSLSRQRDVSRRSFLLRRRSVPC